jgi:capsular exopolysaccharide synthesis family protein
MIKKEISASELNLEKLLNTIVSYKWLILGLMLLSTILMSLNLYFKPSIYASSSIIEIKSKSKPKLPNDILLGALSFGSSGKVEKEMEILRTFLINNKAIEKINFNVKLYVNKNYKDIEQYKTLPIHINKIKVLNPSIIGEKISLYPHKDYFTLELKHSLIDSLLSTISSESVMTLDKNKKYAYNKEVSNKYFKLTITKNSKVINPVKFVICGDHRRVYDNIINKNLNIQQINPNAPLILITYEDNIPKRANDYVDAVTSSFIEESIKAKNEQNNKVLNFINEQLNNIRATLKKSENRLESYKVNNNIVEPSIQAKKYIEKLSTLEIELSENLLQQKLMNNLFIFARHNKNLDTIAPSLMELNAKPTLQLITRLQDLQIAEENLKIELTVRHPKLISIRKQILNIRNKILYNLKNLRSLIKQKNNSLKAEKKSFEVKIKNLPQEEKNLVNIKRDYKVSSTMYDYLLKKKTESELLIVSTLSDYKIIDKAHVTRKPIKPKRTLMMVIAPLIGLFLGIILATILNSLNTKINGKNELEELTDLPILAIIPKLKKKNVQLEVYDDPNSEFTESYRSLRTNLPIKGEGEMAKIIMITSIIANEGKSTLTSNLSAVFQMANYKSIIINLDLRKPTLHEHFNLKNEKGMSSYLSGKDSIQDIIFATKHTGLHVITSGPIPHNPSELLLSYRLTELLDVLKTRYDYIFIDSAPIGLVSDSIQLMKLADTNIVIFREDFAEHSFITSLHNLIEKNNLSNVGLVLNQSKRKNNKHTYGYGYGYGDK